MLEPKVAVATVVFHENKILLIKRANEPNKGQWTFPGGKVLLGETLQQAAERETLEETNIIVIAESIIHTFELIEYNHDKRLQFHYIIIDMEAKYISGTARAQDDALETGWIKKEDLAALNINPDTLKLLSRNYDFI